MLPVGRTAHAPNRAPSVPEEEVTDQALLTKGEALSMNSLQNVNDLASPTYEPFPTDRVHIDPSFEIGTVLNLYYQAVTGRFYTAEEREKLLDLLLHMIAPTAGREADELRRLAREYDPDTVTPIELKNLRLMFMLAGQKPEAEVIIVNTMLYTLTRQKEQKRLYGSRVEWFRALRMAREDTPEVLFDRACCAYVTGRRGAAAGLFERAAAKSPDTDLWRLAGCALIEIGQYENAYSALCRYAYWNREAFLPVPEAVTSELDELSARLGEETAAALRRRVESDAEKGTLQRIGF